VQIDFWFEFASIYSYLAASRIDDLARAAGVRVRWEPFLMASLCQAQGWSDSPFHRNPIKDRYVWRDVERRCHKYQLPFEHPSPFPQNSLLAARVATVAAGQTWLPDFVRAVYRASFADTRDISDPATISEILHSLGQPAEDTISRARAPANKEALQAQTQRAVDIGIFGTPTFAVDAELFWGDDHLEDAIEWCLEVNAARRPRLPTRRTRRSDRPPASAAPRSGRTS
jgi:2-hydroxychromene-2-carboxylate isomerase